MIGILILTLYILVEIILHVVLWGQTKPVTIIGWKSLGSFAFDIILTSICIIYW